jgi:hypothetical protein
MWRSTEPTNARDTIWNEWNIQMHRNTEIKETRLKYLTIIEHKHEECIKIEQSQKKISL